MSILDKQTGIDRSKLRQGDHFALGLLFLLAVAIGAIVYLLLLRGIAPRNGILFVAGEFVMDSYDVLLQRKATLGEGANLFKLDSPLSIVVAALWMGTFLFFSALDFLKTNLLKHLKD